MRQTLATLALCCLPFAAFADEVSDKLQSALDAYAKGDLKAASLDIAMATGALAQVKAERIKALLPAAPDGWTMTMNDDYTANLAMAGGGAGTEATYTDPNGSSLTLSITADSPMMMGMAGMFMNEQMLAMMGKLVEVPGAKLLEQDNSLTTLLDQRIMVSFTGMPTDQMMPLVEKLDFARLAAFDTGS